ncbi:MAG: GcvT family protein, partial [Rhodospirillaceae bacterium]|nr:GcvT family protein [Rhodospirillaceae bacterium]
MTDKARAVVIGGGIAGCALLYHLAKRGWTDSILVEKGELTSGSTWHAAGNTPLYWNSYILACLHKQTVDFYKAFAAETGRDIGFHQTGSLKLWTSPEQITENLPVAAMVRAAGTEVEMIGPDELGERFPYLNLDGALGAAWVPGDGHVDPSSLTNALAAEARAMGTEIRRHTRVIGLNPRLGGGWTVETEKGAIEAGQVINAAGLHAREVAALAGHALPVVPMERQYLVTEDVPGIEDLPHELPVLRDTAAPLYIRQEQRGLLLGLFDDAPVFWAPDGTPEDFDTDLLPNDLDRVSHAFERALERIPVLNELGVKRVLNGPLMRTPDAAPLAGPVPGLADYWLNNGFFAGFAQACATSGRLARWITEGEPDQEMGFADPRRYGPWADGAYTIDRTRTEYVHEYGDGSQAEAAPPRMPARSSALYETLAGRGAAYTELAGWEAPDHFGSVAAECRTVREKAAIMDLSALAKFELAGPDAADVLDRLCAGRIPKKPGGIAVNPVLTPEGRLAAFLLVIHPGPERYYVTAPARAERVAADLLARALGDGADARLANLSEASGALMLSGPEAATVLGRAAGLDLGEKAFPRFTARAFALGGADILALRIAAMGGPGFELHAAMADLPAVYAALR